jgi:hypothetical protein
MSATIATAQTYEPEAGSVPARVLDLFVRNPDEEFTSGDLALKYVVRSEKFSALLAGAISCGLLLYERTTASDGSKVWRAGPHLKAWAASRDVAAMAVAAASSRGLTQWPAAKPAAAPKPARPRRMLTPASPSIDLAAVPVLKGVPIPEAVRGGANGSRYAALWDRLGVGDAFELPDRQAAGLAAYCKKNRRSFTVRTTGAGIKTIWRTA